MKILKRSRRKFDSAFKAKVAIEALKELEILSGFSFNAVVEYGTPTILKSEQES